MDKSKSIATNKLSTESNTNKKISSRNRLCKDQERHLRISQSTRLLHKINDTIHELDFIKDEPKSCEFRVPHEIQQNERRWKEFVHSTGRNLYTLKRDVSS